ncbi:uncharacterized protein F4807DRAFT_458307 [Annulohypoxylon truncatum]|uniref:uncharacterized protein n=1 Tax=Annulohypoxylon truncatum TaxID=327061 RepID=UPI002008638C|nr:uncharacterized protein F4807DRAFT_458307 [Annulohypoxylon truncatum]KAI1212105.1 hypothetical protein F4807DRAFT_458307 [Annulohypoxylon truncatum]
MCTDLLILTICPLCQAPQHTQLVYQRGCDEALEAGRLAGGDFAGKHGSCAEGLARERRTRAANEACGVCRWKAWVRARQRLRGVDFWAVARGDGRRAGRGGGLRNGPVMMMTGGGWRVIG